LDPNQGSVDRVATTRSTSRSPFRSLSLPRCPNRGSAKRIDPFSHLHVGRLAALTRSFPSGRAANRSVFLVMPDYRLASPTTCGCRSATHT